ncbi:MAG: hypothetical protein ACTSY1_11450, partial [Alphaproteobacteria bacterium]
MADEDQDVTEAEDEELDTDEEAEGEGDEKAGSSKRFSGRFLVLFIALPILLLSVAGAGAYF